MNRKTIPIILAGAGGRMGHALLAALARQKSFTLAGAWENPDSPFYGKDVGLIAGGEKTGIIVGKAGENFSLPRNKARPVLVDFSHAAALPALCQAAEKKGFAYVCGTTGLRKTDHARLAKTAKKIPVVYSGNMSLGIGVLSLLVERAANLLGAEWDIELLDFHHRHKRDAPSGTALLLAEAAKRGRGRGKFATGTREGKRQTGEIGFAALRGGTAAGEHRVLFAGPYERLELSHHAEDRRIFAQGALEAARWVCKQKSGLFSLADVLAENL